MWQYAERQTAREEMADMNLHEYIVNGETSSRGRFLIWTSLSLSKILARFRVSLLEFLFTFKRSIYHAKSK